MKAHWKAFLGVILIFLFGCLSGAVSTSIFFHHMMIEFLQHPGVKLSAALEKRLTGNLDLDEAQKKQVHELFAENLEHRKDVQKQIQPQVKALNRQTMQEIIAILRPDQVDRFHQNLERIHKRLGAVGFTSEADNFSPPDTQLAPALAPGTANPPVPAHE
jgi:hypothetical protein